MEKRCDVTGLIAFDFFNYQIFKYSPNLKFVTEEKSAKNCCKYINQTVKIMPL